MNKLTKLQIEILSEYYARSFDAWEAWGDIYDALEKHGNDKKYTIYRVMCKHMGTILGNKANKIICEMNNKKTISYLMNYSEIFISKFSTEKKSRNS